MKTIKILIVIYCFFCFTSTVGQGQLWGVTQNGGIYGDGVVYRTNIDGSNHFVQKSFSTVYTGVKPYSKLTQASNGKLYGTTPIGGNSNSGVIYEFDPTANTYLKKFDFNQYSGTGWSPISGLTQAPNGKLYGMTNQGGNSVGDYGVIFEFDPITSIYQKKYTFTGVQAPNGGFPESSLTLASNGKLYGVTPGGGINFYGVLFEFDPVTSVFTKKIDFSSNGLRMGKCALVFGPNGKLYGTAYDFSTAVNYIFEYDISTNSLIRKTSSSNVVGSTSDITITSGGKIYGASGAITGGGVIYEFDTNTNVYTQKYSFGSPAADGAETQGVMVASNGKLYGITSAGGLGISASPLVYGYGILYEYNLTTNIFTKKHQFQINPTGSNPRASIIQASDGMIYGTTSDETLVPSRGTIFQFNPASDILIKKFTFSHASDGKSPIGGVIKHGNGRFYGLTNLGGSVNTGSWYGLDLGYTPPTPIIDFVTMPSFTTPISNSGLGSYPEGGFAKGADGSLYGITSKGGQNGFGCIFRTTPGADLTSASSTPLYSFTFDHSVSGAQCGLVLASNGKMYGMTSKGGTNNVGTIYEFNGGVVTTLFNFASVASGDSPFGNLMQATNGKLYGMTYSGGSNNSGVIFEFDPVTLIFTKKMDFSSTTSGANPRGNLFQASNGKIYGMTSLGGTTNQGVLFEYDIALSTFTKKLDFSSTTGTNPYGSLMQSPNSKLYATTYAGGSSNLGVLFEYDPVTSTYTKKLDYNGTNGANPVGTLFSDQLPKSVQAITFSSQLTKQLNDAPFTIATASSGLAVSLTSSNSAVATVSGNIVTPVGVGVTNITASQTGDATYYPAVSATRLLTIKPIPVIVSAGTNYSMVLSCGGGVSATGTNSNGQLGDGTLTTRTSAVPVLGLTGVIAVSAGRFHTLFLKDDGTVWATGLNANGQLGDFTLVSKSTPIKITSLSAVIAISAGSGSHSLFLKSDGTVWACGLNSSGQLGDGTLVQRTFPVKLNSLSGIKAISAGFDYSLFLKNDNTVWGTGGNSFGQLGDGTTISKITPGLLSSLSGITAISTGSAHSLFLKNDGTVWACGSNGSGQLADGTTMQRNTPVLVSGLSSISAISTGTDHSFFIKSDGTIRGCGSGSSLGIGITANQLTPVQISTLLGVKQVDGASNHSIFYKNDGTAWTTGTNTNGQLGDGTLIDRFTPVQMINVNPCGRVRGPVVQQEIEKEVAPEVKEPVTIYPNPVDGELAVELAEDVKQITPVALFDSFGKTMIQSRFNTGERVIRMNTGELISGMYFLRIETHEGMIRRKVLVVH